MEIRNNTPSFGMAFMPKKLSLKDAQILEEDIFGHRHRSVHSTIRRGLEQIKREQIGNKHYDITYETRPGYRLSSQFNLVEKSTGNVLESVKIGDGYNGCVYEGSFARAEKVAKNARGFWGNLGAIVKQITTLTDAILFNPKETLPAGIRYLADEATRLDKIALQQEKNTSFLTK